jgi:hypothetical protein
MPEAALHSLVGCEAPPGVAEWLLRGTYPETKSHWTTLFHPEDIEARLDREDFQAGGAVPMLTECFNPACRRKLEYLRNGRVIRTISTAGSDPSVEHYWLCGTCYGNFDFDFQPDGSVTLCPRRTPAALSTRPLIDYLAG